MSLFGLHRGLIEAVGQVATDFGGVVFTRLTADLPPAPQGAPDAAALTALVESTHGWPAASTVTIRGERIPYAGKTITTLTGLTRDPTNYDTYRRGELVALSSGDVTALDRARAGLLVDTAEGAFLDVLGRNYGIPRYLDASDAGYRTLIRVLAYQRGKGTLTAIAELLDALLGSRALSGADGVIDAAARTLTSASAQFTALMADMRVRMVGSTRNTRTCKIVSATADTLTLEPDGSPFWRPASLEDGNVSWEIVPYDLFVDPWRHSHLIVRLNVAPPTSPVGFAYLQGGEVVMSDPADLSKVTVSAKIRQVLGVWLAEDPLRAGTNYATTNNFSGRDITLDVPLAKPAVVIVDYGSVATDDDAVAGLPGAADAPATGQLMENVDIHNPGDTAEATALGVAAPITRYPLYLGDRVGTIRAILDLVVAAGVIPELHVRTW